VAYLPDNPTVSCIAADLPDNALGIFRHSPMEYMLTAFCFLVGFYLLWVLIRELAQAVPSGTLRSNPS
jgi:hypothetical protein